MSDKDQTPDHPATGRPIARVTGQRSTTGRDPADFGQIDAILATTTGS